MKRAVFLDRDGTLNKDMGRVKSVDKLEILPGVIDGLKMLTKKYTLIIISNQSGIGQSFYTEEDHQEVMKKMLVIFKKNGIHISAHYHCPHHPEKGIGEYKQDCDCRKPKNGMILQAAQKYDIDLKESWLIGDAERDIEAGKKSSCRTIILGTEKKNADFAARDIKEAASIILSHQ